MIIRGCNQNQTHDYEIMNGIGFKYYDKAKDKYVCPHCPKEMPSSYKGVKAGGDTRKAWIDDKAGLARANFERHLQSHQQ